MSCLVALALLSVPQYAMCAANGDVVSLLQTTAHKLHRPSLHLVHEAERRSPSLLERRQRTCTDCTPMCHWLKLSSKSVPAKHNFVDKDTSSCPLLEMQLRSAGWIAPEKRTATDFAENVDCTVEIVRSNVRPNEVDTYASRLTMCLRSLPAETVSKYQVAITLLESELADFEQERKTLADVTKLRQEFWDVCNKSQDALTVHKNEVAVIQELQKTLAEAERMKGHFLVEEIRTARQYLEQLLPIPAAKAALSLAIKDAKDATSPASIEKSNAKELGDLWPLIVRLNISVLDAEELQLPDQVPEAKQVLADLISFRDKMHRFRRDMQIANISYGTKNGMREARDKLQRSEPWAKAVGLERGLPRAEILIGQLNASLQALHQLRIATEHGDRVIHANEKNKLEDLDSSMESLNYTLDTAKKANIGGHNVFLRAVSTLDMLEYIAAAKKALEASEIFGKEVLASNQSDLDDARQQAGIQKLLPTIRWAREVGIKHGLAAASDIVDKLQLVAEAKGNMTEALAVGKASRDAKFGEEDAIKELTEALARNKAAKCTAGDADAKELLALLDRRQRAKDALKKASDVARIALETGEKLEDASMQLRELLTRLNAVGLDQQASIAQTLLQALQQAIQSKQELKNSTLRRSSGTYGGISSGNVSGTNHSAGDVDFKGMFAFSRNGYKPVHLAKVDGSKDDGDEDFQEHIDALEVAIKEQHARGVIDPEDEVELELFRRKEQAYASLQAATHSGQAAFDRAQTLLRIGGLEEVTEKVMEAISMAEHLSVKAGLPEAQQVLSLLQRVEPAMDEFSAAMLQANISYTSESHMGEALSRLNSAMEECKELGLTEQLDEGETLYAVLSKLKGIRVGLKAAMLQGQHALDRQQGEEAALEALRLALQEAKEVHLRRDVPLAQDFLQELGQMQEEQEDLAAAINPYARRTEQRVTRSGSSASKTNKTMNETVWSSGTTVQANRTGNRTEEDEPLSMKEQEEFAAAKKAER